jgi:hypothetical protein
MSDIPSGVVVSPLAAAVFAAMLRQPLRRRISPTTGIHPSNAAELWAAFSELERVGEVWKGSRGPISVSSRPVTEMHAGLSPDMEISSEKAGELLDRTTSRVRQLLRSGELSGRKVGGRWVVRKRDVLAYANSSGRLAA